MHLLSSTCITELLALIEKRIDSSLQGAENGFPSGLNFCLNDITLPQKFIARRDGEILLPFKDLRMSLELADDGSVMVWNEDNNDNHCAEPNAPQQPQNVRRFIPIEIIHGSEAVMTPRIRVVPEDSLHIVYLELPAPSMATNVYISSSEKKEYENLEVDINNNSEHKLKSVPMLKKELLQLFEIESDLSSPYQIRSASDLLGTMSLRLEFVNKTEVLDKLAKQLRNHSFQGLAVLRDVLQLATDTPRSAIGQLPTQAASNLLEFYRFDPMVYNMGTTLPVIIHGKYFLHCIAPTSGKNKVRIKLSHYTSTCSSASNGLESIHTSGEYVVDDWEIISDSQWRIHPPILDIPGLYILSISLDKGETWLLTSRLNLMIFNHKQIHAAINCGGPAYLSIRGIYYMSHAESCRRGYLKQGIVDYRFNKPFERRALLPVIGSQDEQLYQSWILTMSPVELEFSIPVNIGQSYYVILKFIDCFVESSKMNAYTTDIVINGVVKASKLVVAHEAAMIAKQRFTREKDGSIESKATFPTVGSTGAAGVDYQKYTVFQAQYYMPYMDSDTISIKLPHSMHINALVIVKGDSPDPGLCMPSFVNPAITNSATTSSIDIEKTISLFEGISLKSSLFLLEYEGKPSSENLIINGSGELGDLTGWDILANGGEGWLATQVTDIEGCSSYFKSSFAINVKAQTVDLIQSKGFSEEFLHSKPAIHVGENVINGVGECVYAFRAELLDRDRSTIIDTYEYQTNKLTENLQIRHSFKSYSKPVYFVRITHAGKDGVFWRGNCGPRIFQTFVTVTMSQNTRQMNTSDTNTENDKPNKQFHLLKDGLFHNDDKIIAKCRATTKKVREIKFFVSSTFRDFIAERDHLSRKIFVNIRAFCEERNIAFTEIDLRWGVLGCADTIEICLDGIDECRPFYMCMLAERYGWCQPKDTPIDKALADTKYKAQLKYKDTKKYDWINNFPNSSVTELEIRHAVLNHLHLLNKHNNDTLTDEEHKLLQCIHNVQFYFRNNDKTGKLHIGNDFQSESIFHANQMNLLKNEIKNYNCFNIKEYTNIEEFGNIVYEKTIQQIQEQYPLQLKPNKLEIERDLHDNFALFRSRCYIPINKYFIKLNEYFNQMFMEIKELPNDHPDKLKATKPLVVYGNSGSGKSALVANWWINQEIDLLKICNNKLLIITHYIGATIDSTNHFSLMRRIMLEIKSYLLLPQDIPIDPLQIQKEFQTYLNIISSRCPMLLIIDALNQLEDRHQALSLSWLPNEFPINIRVIVSTTEVSPVLAHCRQLGYQELHVTALDPIEGKELITKYLKQYSKTLQPSDAEFIINAPCGGSPLFIRSLLEELRMDALYETLTNKIQYYCNANDLETFFELMLQRFELQYENDFDGSKGVFGSIFSAIALSRHGISEREIINLTNLDRSVLQPFFNVLHGFLVSRGGLLSFFHDHFRNAVNRKYLSDPTKKTECYEQLILMFESHDSLGRKADELPFHLKSTEQYERLRQVISDISLLKLLLSPEREYDLIDYWKTIQAHKDDPNLTRSSCQPIQSYRQQLDDYMVLYPLSKVIEAIELVGRLMSKLGYKAEAELLFKEALIKRDTMENVKVSESIGNEINSNNASLDDITYALEHDFSSIPQKGFTIEEDIMIQHYGEVVCHGDNILLRVHNKRVHPVQIISPTAEQRYKNKGGGGSVNKPVIYYGDVIYFKTVSVSLLDTYTSEVAIRARAAEYVTKDYEDIQPGYYWTVTDRKKTIDRRTYSEPIDKSAFRLIKVGSIPVNESSLPVRYGDIYIGIQDCVYFGYLSDHWNTIEGGITDFAGDFERWEILHNCNQYYQYSTLHDAKLGLLSIYSPDYGKAIWYNSITNHYYVCRNKYPRQSKHSDDCIWYYNNTKYENTPLSLLSLSNNKPILIWKQLSIERLQNLLSLASLSYEQEKYDQTMSYYTQFFLFFHGQLERGTSSNTSTNIPTSIVFGNNPYCSLFEHGIAYLHALYGYARVCYVLHKLYECEQYIQKFLYFVRHILGESHYYYAIGLSFQSELLFFLQRNDQAKAWMLDCLYIIQTNLGLLHPFTGIACHNLGILVIKVEGLNDNINNNATTGHHSGEEYLQQAEHILQVNAGSCQEELISLKLNQIVVLAMQIDDFKSDSNSQDGKRVHQMKEKIEQCRKLMESVGFGEEHAVSVSLRKLQALLL